MALLLSILFNSLIGVIFKLFPKKGIDTQQAIVFNYMVCVACGIFIFDVNPIATFESATWNYHALVLGFFFITGFYFLGKTVEHHGVAVTTVTQKMSLLISISLSIYLYKEQLIWTKGIGIILAIIALILVTGVQWKKQSQSNKRSTYGLFLLAFTFIVSGFIESLLQYVERNLASESGDPAFVTTLFGIAGLLGSIWLLVRLLNKRASFHWKNLLAGIILGLPNFGSIYFLMRALGTWEGSVVFSVNNVSIIAVTSLVGVFLFKESFTTKKWIGMALSLVAIYLMIR